MTSNSTANNADFAKTPISSGNTNSSDHKNSSDIDAIIALLDDYAVSGGSRMKINVVDGDGSVVEKQYHHGRCDVGSPWAKGQAFDVLEG